MQKIGRVPEQRTFSERIIDRYLHKIERVFLIFFFSKLELFLTK